LKASSPPAEAPIPTIGQPFASDDRRGVFGTAARRRRPAERDFEAADAEARGRRDFRRPALSRLVVRFAAIFQARGVATLSERRRFQSRPRSIFLAPPAAPGR
jgi:hypothetical protein